MQELTVTLDRLAPQVIEMARFVLAGDMGQSDALKELVDSWMDVVCLFAFIWCFSGSDLNFKHTHMQMWLIEKTLIDIMTYSK